MRLIDLRVQNAVRVIEQLLAFFEGRLAEPRPLISKDIAFLTFSRYERLSKLLYEFSKKQSEGEGGFAASGALLGLQEGLERTFLDPQLVDDLATTLANSWPFLENTFCENIDVTDAKKEVTVKLKCQSHPQFSQEREDVAVLALVLYEEFCRYVDQAASALSVLFLNPRTTLELQHGDSLKACKGFRRFFEVEKGHSDYPDFYQKLIRYLSSLSDSLEGNVAEMKAFRFKRPEPEADKAPLLIGHKHGVYKDFVQKKITGLISLIQKKSGLGGKPEGGDFDDMTSDFLSSVVNEVSMQQFEEHLKELGALGKT